MATNDFLPFCATDSGSNLLSQAAYITDSQRPIGNQPGIARSVLVNKALRQATYIVGAVAQFISNITGDDVLDDATQSEVLTTLGKTIAPRNQIALSTPSGYGSGAGNVVLVYSAVDSTVGSNLTYTHDTVNGDSITVNKDGAYSLFTSFNYTAGTNPDFGFTKNYTGFTTLIQSVPAANLIAFQTSKGNSIQVCLSITELFLAGDVIRVQSDGNPVDTASNPSLRFMVTQVSS